MAAVLPIFVKIINYAKALIHCNIFAVGRN